MKRPKNIGSNITQYRGVMSSNARIQDDLTQTHFRPKYNCVGQHGWDFVLLHSIVHDAESAIFKVLSNK